jgi:hypothetical protein
MEARRQIWLMLLVVACFGMGAMIYIIGRPAGSAYLLPDAWHIHLTQPVLAGVTAQTAPAFLHALAFSLLTGWCLAPWQCGAAVACLFWFVVDGGFELAQIDSIALLVNEQLPDVFARVDAYLLNGTFDPLDLGMTALGCSLAYLLLRRGVA